MTFGDENSYSSAITDIEWTDVEPGIRYGSYSHPGVDEEIPPVFVHMLQVDLSRPDLTVRSLRPLGRSLRMEKIVEVFREGDVDVRAAINGDYFSFIETEKDPLGLHVSGAQLLWFPGNTSSLIVSEDNRVHMGRYKVVQKVSGKGFNVTVSGANRKKRKEESAILYSGYYREKTAAQPGCTGLLLGRSVLEAMVNSEFDVTVKEVFRARMAKNLEPMELALIVCGDDREAAEAVKVEAALTISTQVQDFEPLVMEAISGGPRVLRDGEIVKEIRDEAFTLPLKFYIPRKHPRSAVGISRDGKTIYLMVAEGRIRRSEGMTAQESAALLKAAGAWDAMLFDGGGSAALLGPDGFYNIPHSKRKHTMRDLANTLAVIRLRTR